jgi:methylase of polypeptide subunit release factors
MTHDEVWLLKEKYHGEKSCGFFADCERLAAGEPLGYVIGHVPFLGCTIWLDSHPLIPRPETEYWVEYAIKTVKQTGGGDRTTRATNSNPTEGSPREIPRATLGKKLPHTPETQDLVAESLGRERKDPGSPVHILDLCAGSGAIGVAVAKHVPGARVDFGEIDPCHETTIRKNLSENGIAPERSQVIISDLFADITDRYDFILSNPPYINPALDRTQVSVKDFEPHLALYGGPGGLALIERIIATAPTHLTPDGQLWLEHEPEQSSAIHTLATLHGCTATTHLDQYQVERYSILVLQ